MSKETDIEHGSDYVFRNLERMKAVVTARITSVLDDKSITVRRAQELTGFAAADFSRVRNGKIGRFTLDKLIRMLLKLDEDIEIIIEIRPRQRAAGA